MTAVPATRPAVATRSRPPWLVVAQGAAALAAAMGVGRFAYTPILPLMHAQAGLSAQAGASLATANYAGYLAGAVAATVLPALNRSRAVMRVSLAVLIATLVLMPASHEQASWLVLRLVAGLASALVFVSGIGAVLGQLRGLPHHLTGWVFSGVGAGIALSGVLVLIVRQESTWSVAWWACAGLALVLSAGAWSLAPARDPGPAPGDPGSSRARWGWRFGVLLTSYSLEGVGYIIAGTFLVAAIDQDAPGWIGSGAWVLVGLAALPSAVLWAWLGHRWSRPGLLMALLLIQAAGIALPALISGVVPALLSAVLFGATFIGAVILAVAIGAQLQVGNAVAVLTSGYGVGQILGPLVVTPLIGHGYHTALLTGGAIAVAAALAAGVLRAGFPRDAGAAGGAAATR
jgi:predicted MFS family arabinose efflux permease